MRVLACKKTNAQGCNIKSALPVDQFLDCPQLPKSYINSQQRCWGMHFKCMQGGRSISQSAKQLQAWTAHLSAIIKKRLLLPKRYSKRAFDSLNIYSSHTLTALRNYTAVMQKKACELGGLRPERRCLFTASYCREGAFSKGESKRFCF